MKNRKSIFLFFFFSLFIYGVYAQSFAIKNKTQFFFPYRDNSVEKVYDYLGKKGEPKDIAIELSLRPIINFRLNEINLRKELFYYPNIHPRIIQFYFEFTQSPPYFYENKNDMIYYINWKDFSTSEKQKIFFIVWSKKQTDEDDRAYNILSSFMKGTDLGRYTIFEMALYSQDKERGYIQFLSKVNKKTPKKYKGTLLETLIYYAYKNKNKKEFKRLLQEYRDIEMALDEFIPHFNYPSRFELRRRVKRFESLNWNE